MTEDNKFITDLKAKGYTEGDMSTLPSDISDSDRRKVEEHEADLANERVKNVSGVKPTLGKYHTELNPNQYGYAEQTGKIDPLDRDGDGKRGGSLPKSERDGKK